MDFNSIYKLFFSLTFIFEYANLFRCSNQKETRTKKMRRSHRIVETGIARISCWKISRCHPSVQFYTRKRSSQLEQLRAVYFTNTGHARGSIFLWMLPRSNYLVPRVSVCLSSPPSPLPPETMDDRTKYEFVRVQFRDFMQIQQSIRISISNWFFLNVNSVGKIKLHLSFVQFTHYI